MRAYTHEGLVTPTSQHILTLKNSHKFFLCSGQGLNIWPLDLESDALPIEPPHHPFSFYAWRPSAVVAPTCKICWPFLKLVKARITSWLMTSSALFQSLLKPRTICCTRAAAQHKLSRFNSYSGLSNSCEFVLMLMFPTRASTQISVFKVKYS